MKTKIIFGFVVIVLIAAGIYYFNFHKKEQMIGGQKDEHGCLIPAGYSWCEASRKCLRTWEEYCADEAPEAPARIKEILAAKYGKEISQVELRVNHQDQSHLTGSVSFLPGGPRESGMFLATKVNGEWQLLYDGNGSVDCEGLKGYNFPPEMLEG